MTSLYWLPKIDDFQARLVALRSLPYSEVWSEATCLANSRLNFVQTNALDETMLGVWAGHPPLDLSTIPVRLALLGSCTLAHLHAGIRVAGMRRGIHISTYENDYGQYWQELADSSSALHAFRPTTVLLCLDGHHLAAELNASMSDEDVNSALEDVVDRIRACWVRARMAFGCQIIHQLPLPVFAEVLGNNEHRLPGSRQAFLFRLCEKLRLLADAEAVDLIALDMHATAQGLASWHDFGLWYRAKQEISPISAPFYGDLVSRSIAAKQGRSSKCLVLDLDNTLWGGVIGDDGLEGIVIGQGSALGEAYAAFQDYVRELSRRGVILAVCSKNEEANAMEAFERHPEMVLRRSDIACLVANWNDKAANIRSIANTLNIGLDALVFIDDNPFERALVRRELPMVAVPEVSDDPTFFARTIADAGYFEGLWVTDDDRARGAQYQGNQQREALKASATDLPAYLHGLEMKLIWRRFDKIGLQRIVQLINKTNQFNLTTRRYTEVDILRLIDDQCAFGLQLRLLDRFGDNGVIAIVIGRLTDGSDLLIDTWLMSCRVLGRQVEPTMLNIIAAEARRLEASRLIGEYRPTAKNAMVREHYQRLGFTLLNEEPSHTSRSVLDLADFVPAETFIEIKEDR